MNEKLLNIREAAQFLGVSVDTLRRWDKSGKLVALRKPGGTHRYYAVRDLEIFSSDLIKLASEWALSRKEISPDLYCSNSAVFQARLMRMQDEMLASAKEQGFVSLVTAVAGEIGNNSYDHNLGNWPVAFTEMLSGRAPEERGNGLKFVRKVISQNPISLCFQTGDAELGLERGNGDLRIRKTKNEIQGCLAVIRF
ncbi:MAG: hypothetical protein Greene071421_113 [Parcubacteria group bacterium Greene0714_21]|nr:MAG: hypothetical protein Greene041639_238 [Parcubacteria group bacterium Greene0416_39]TSC98515.1 MAG: hypothetical protein Greene101447_17 [Parcubacteria group bacterium Greene1014_47]TSD04277.1 MAG: hypothetical protein Greene071421_113 [Parcubacteria group bacterium Greene0714_21]